jgi:hypothetical protein
MRRTFAVKVHMFPLFAEYVIIPSPWISVYQLDTFLESLYRLVFLSSNIFKLLLASMIAKPTDVSYMLLHCIVDSSGEIIRCYLEMNCNESRSQSAI